MKTWLIAISSLVAAAGASAARLASDVPSPLVAAHQHLISPEFAKLLNLPPQDGAAFLKMLDEAGIRRGVVLSMGYSFGDERKKIPEADRDQLTAEENDWTSQQVVQSHGRLVGFCGVNPLRDAALAEIDRCLNLPGMIGVKLHFANSGVSMRNSQHVARLQKVFAEANARHAPIVVHLHARTGSPYGAEDAQIFLEKLLPYAPNVVVQVAHLAGSGEFPPDAEEAMKAFESAIQRHDPRTRNLYFDQSTVATASTSPADGARIAEAIRAVGVKRMFFGSDMVVSYNPPPGPSWAIFEAKVPLTPSEFRAIALNVPPYMRR
ncbi:MAG TPA: amidohydrolase family protein [Sphingomicrobium sp.]|nr:amidohydrolase family protein [Sphingomicrobium sp.]